VHHGHSFRAFRVLPYPILREKKAPSSRTETCSIQSCTYGKSLSEEFLGRQNVDLFFDMRAFLCLYIMFSLDYVASHDI